MTEFITQGKTAERYRLLSKDFVESEYNQLANIRGFEYFRSDTALALVYGNEILSIADIPAKAVYTVYGQVAPVRYRGWLELLMHTMGIDLSPAEYFVGLEEPSKLRK